jgi:hypothetical protein
MRKKPALSRSGVLRERLAANGDGFARLVAMMIPDRRRQRRLLGLDGASPVQERSMDEERPVVTEANTERIRQGVTGHNVRYVVIAGIALVVVLFVAVAMFVRP